MQELRYIGTNQEAMLWSSHQPGGDAMVLAPTRRRCYGPRTNQEAMLWCSHQPGGDAMVLAPTRRRCYGPRTNQEAMLWSSHQPGGDAVVLAPTRRRCYGPRTNQEAMRWSSLISSLDVGTTFPNSGKNKINLSFLTRPYYGAARGGVGFAFVYDLLAAM